MINNLYSLWYILPCWSFTKSILAFWISVKFAIKRYTIWLLLKSFDFPHFHDFSRQKLMPILGYTSNDNPNFLSLAFIGPLPPLRKLYKSITNKMQVAKHTWCVSFRFSSLSGLFDPLFWPIFGQKIPQKGVIFLFLAQTTPPSHLKGPKNYSEQKIR